MSQSHLGRHLGVAKSTLSEALSGLEVCGFIVRQPDGADNRGTLIIRTASGSAAMSSGSVLETERLREVLEVMTGEERHRAVEGLEIIARAALRVAKGEDDV